MCNFTKCLSNTQCFSYYFAKSLMFMTVNCNVTKSEPKQRDVKPKLMPATTRL